MKNNNPTEVLEKADFVDVASNTDQHNKKKFKPLVFLNTILCMILLIALSILLNSSLSMRDILSNNILSNAVSDVDTEDLSRFIYGYIEDSRIEEDNVINIIDEANVQEFIEGIVKNYSQYMLDGEDFQPLTADMIIDYIEDNKEIIRKETNLKYVDDDKDYIRQEIEEPLSKFNTSLEDSITFIKIMNSLPFIIALAVVMVLIFIQWLFIYIKNKVSINRLFELNGIAILIPSILIVCTTLLMNPILKILLPDELSFVTKYTNQVKEAILINTGMLLILGLASLVISITLTLISSAFKREKIPVGPSVRNIDTKIDSNNAKPIEEIKEKNIVHEVNKNESEVKDIPQEVALKKDNIENKQEVQEISQNDIAEVEKDDTVVTNEKKFKYCTSCGHRLLRKAIYCDKCGSKVN